MPAQPAEPMMRVLRRRMVHSKRGAWHSAAYQREKNDCCELNSKVSSHEVAFVWDWSLSTLSASAAILSHAVKPTNPTRPTDRYLGTSDRPVTSFHYYRLLSGPKQRPMESIGRWRANDEFFWAFLCGLTATTWRDLDEGSRAPVGLEW